MGIVSSGALYDALCKYRLLRPQQLAEVPHLAQGRHADVRLLTKLLIQRGWLTIHQANEVLSGNAADLVIGPYHVLDILGEGGLSRVFKARHAEQGWVVALKVLRPEAIENEAGRRQFLHEMEAMAQMNHPNIVEFCDVDQAGATFYFAMEFVEGVDLGKQVGLGGPLAVGEACEYTRQAALGLQHAHERNLVHRDIKPANLFLTHVPLFETGRLRPRDPVPTKPLIKILDWGLVTSRLPRNHEESNHGESGPGGKILLGTIDYLSPEQARDAARVDIRGDIYSLGCTFYFLLTGKPPFAQGNLAQKLYQHLTAEPPSLFEIRPDVPAELIQVLKRMLAKDPAARFQTPAAAALALVPFARDLASPMPTLPLKNRAPSGNARRDDTPLPGALRKLGLPNLSGRQARQK